MNKLLLIVALFAGIASTIRADTISPLWSAWKAQHKKAYSATEEIARFALFVENLNKIAKLNAKNSTVKYAINKFADLTATEFKQIHASGALFDNHRKEVTRNFFRRNLEVEDLPDSIDWRTKGAVTPVKDQGQCASCWAFSAIAVLESFNFIQNGELLSFSEQQLMDCAEEAGSGCHFGHSYKAVQYAAQSGLHLESDYPYIAKGGVCSYNASITRKVNSDYQFITPQSTNKLKAALVDSPVSVLIEADQGTFQFYKSGVINSTNCGTKTDHAVLVVGYKKIDDIEAFIVKNSWGSTWGSEGYVHISTNQEINEGLGTCGILSRPMVPTK